MAIFVRRFGKFLKKKGYSAKRKRLSSKRKEEQRCYDWGRLVILWPIVPTRRKSKSKKDKECKTMTFKKKKKGHAYCVEWDSNASSDSEDKKKSRSLSGITINKKPSIFETHSSCFMAKGPKVQYDASASASDS